MIILIICLKIVNLTGFLLLWLRDFRRKIRTIELQRLGPGLDDHKTMYGLAEDLSC